MTKKSLAQILLESGLITQEQLKEAEELRQKMGLPLSSALVYLGFVAQKDLAKKIAEQIGLPFIDFESFSPDQSAISSVSEEIARKYSVFPVKIEGNSLILAMTNPKDIIAIEEIKTMTGLEIRPAVAIKEEIDTAIDLYYKPLVEEEKNLKTESEHLEATEIDTFSLKTAIIESVDLNRYNIDPNAVMTTTEEIARKHKIIPIAFEGGELVVAMANPKDIFVIDTLSILTGFDIKPVKAEEHQIEEAISRFFKMAEVVEVGEEIENLIGGDSDAEKLKEISVISEEAPIVKLVNHLIAKAVKSRASDIHIEPMEKDVRVRFRIDGVLHEIMRSPKRLQAALISRLKIMANLDIAERRKPQDGHCAVTIGGKVYDFRVATLPTIYGERVVLRVLAKESILLRLEDLGFLEDSLEIYTRNYRKSYGAIMITGPTGSGKSTTLYATLNVLNTPEKNIVTIEDPVEYRLKGINQIQINPKAGLTFARVLRAMLRAAPDIIMVGEIRDKETAKIAVEAALTGHLVLSTLHTNDAPSAISRLIEMGVEPFLVSSAIRCVQAQRLARRLCPECKEPYTPKREWLEELRFPDAEEVAVLFRARGCPKCNNTGYKGRIGIYEVMEVNDEIEMLAAKKAPTEKIREAALRNGMRTLRQDGLLKAKLGITSVEEVLRVTV
ncbi:MAG: type II/IV secretion system protein [Actinobacteria bacterium]|nr:type II/IV secretion system protein [Actinomycetota bacterium]